MKTRRSFLRSAGLASTALFLPAEQPPDLLEEFGYGDVELAPGMAQAQFEQTQSVLLGLNEDSLLKPWRLRAGLAAPGPEMGGWYDELPLQKTESGGHGFAPAHSFGQWLSALARGYAINKDARTRAKLANLVHQYGRAISDKFYTNFRFPAYNYDKTVIGLLDAHRFANLPEAYKLLNRTTDAAEPHLPPRALDRDAPQRQWRKAAGENTSDDYTWDESYTLPENLFLAYSNGAGERYRKLANRFLLNETYFDPLSENENILGGHHAYSYCNALNSAMQAYLVEGDPKYLRAGSNAFDMITETQSFSTGGWGPNESFSAPDSGHLYKSLSGTHRGFETPCGSYAHFKLTRYLLRITGDARYGDSMERVLYNTVSGAKQLQPDGRAYYYSDYHSNAKRGYFPDAWPCCSGTLPQVAADYRLLVYFKNRSGVLVNLYVPSTGRWLGTDGGQLALTQTGEYPLDGKIHLVLRASRPSNFALRLRIPEWATEPRPAIRVNGEKLVDVHLDKGFAVINRQWKDGDKIQLDLPLPLRTEPIDEEPLSTVSLVRGPLVLFGIGENPVPLTRKDLLSAVPSRDRSTWRVDGRLGDLPLRPFTAIGDEPYQTYFDISVD